MTNVSTQCSPIAEGGCGDRHFSTRACARCGLSFCLPCSRSHAAPCVQNVLAAEAAEAVREKRKARAAKIERDSRRQMETLVFGWSWQVWTEYDYPGPHWEFWMKCCPRCWKGPLTGEPDDVFEVCDDCAKALRKPIPQDRLDAMEQDRLDAMEMMTADARPTCTCPDKLGNLINDGCFVHGGKVDGGPAT